MNHCYDCGLDWTASGQAHCRSCHEQFNSTAAFDRHRAGTFAGTDTTADQYGRYCIPVSEFGTPVAKRDGSFGPPLLVLAAREHGDVWVTALRDDRD